jgi:hypothetical protein
MAEMGTRGLKPYPQIVPSENAVHAVPLVIVGACTVLCAPANPISASSIMPEGFVTHTDLMPSMDAAVLS